MVVVQPEKLVSLQQAAEGVRNICILAHVDHGKTSLTDALIATNGIISPKLAGKIRYLDSRPDEQLRGITMESSAISLYFSLLRRSAPEAQPEQKEFLINLIDSPGHIDFSYEVSTASRLCDGAVVLVDAVEGVCSQTVTVLRQSWIEKLKPLLVINKMDRLITELKMSPGEAYTHLSKLLEQVNAVMGSFYQGERMEDDLRWREKMEERLNAAAAEKTNTNSSSVLEDGDSIDTTNTPAEYEEKDDEDIYFAPENNNVIFGSAIDGWAFTVKQFAGLYERKLGIKRSVLEKVLWGDFYLDPKTKRVLGSKHLKGRHLKPMFVQLVLENIWALYEATTGGNNGKGDPAMVEKITKSLHIKLPPHILRSRDPRALLTALFAAWLPLSTALLVSVTEYLPPPSKAQAERMPELIDSSPGADYVAPEVRDAMTTFNTSKDVPMVAYVSKMISVPESELPQNKRRGGALTAEEARELGRKKRAEIARQQAIANGENPDVGSITDALSSAAIGETETPEEQTPQTNEDAEHLIGFARIFSGTLNVGDEVYVLNPKFTPANPHAAPEPKKVKITALYLMMGRGLEPLTTVPAGVVFGIGGLEGHILKSGTLCSQLPGSINLAGVQMGTQPIVRVALEPENPYDLDKMIKGLKLLVQSDPCAEYEQLPSGEHVILTAGELHLERCIKDLKERFAKCEIQAGEPIVPYRESTVAAEEMNAPKDPNLPRGTVIGVTASKHVSVRLRVRPLPPSVTEFLSKNAGAIKRLYSEARTDADPHPEVAGGEQDGMEEAEQREIGQSLSLVDFKKQLNDAFAEAKGQKEIWTDVIEKITAFGPRRIGPNILVDTTSAGICGKALRESASPDADATPDRSTTAHTFASTITYAFQLATAQGPCCAEPVQGIAVFLEDVNISIPEGEENFLAQDRGRLTGEVIKAVRSSIHQGFLDWSPRMLLAMYSCEIQASTDVLGRVYAVLTRRRGTILSETMSSSSASTTGNQTFTISALLPVAESFGFSDEIRKRSSGSASPQLRFAGFEMLNEDPFWVPFTEDELEDLGELADRENVARRYMDRVRRRKGLLVREVLVRDAEKQKTLKR
ncbi:P-loop containing nucleoside triphosphate hydrolase protein [Dothidotthia symphoricarpi CBS 119687]|uniref:Ribosome assembly protein 1 n=1 Tax=Dothidotthia symphoricarpi CBS 119687 TaxID=1392245 RepID=A0A6A6A706_9PLEO|nr:P-loop containing nucleoside triphosphate hydrolase protein [Dothidotthia symphoricarpi CBS 119687]KAF2126568.1 P-loop containing nucleoside triphosphate hydrolase protein [Dothidotthia symphoricarpi CBS 119687]